MDIYCGAFHFILPIKLFCTDSSLSFSLFFAVLFNNIATFFEERLSFAWLKMRNKIFALYLRKVSLIKYIR